MRSNEGFERGGVRRLAARMGRFGLVIALWAGPGALMAAPTFTVNTVSDAAADPADTDYSVCRTAANNSTCTLRAAIMKANHFAGGGVTINIPADALPYRLTTPPTGADDETSGDLNITQSMTINGAGAGTTIIDGNLTDRVLHIQADNGTINISGVTIRNGKASQVGGGIYLDKGGLILSNSTVSGNTGFHGGGIFVTSSANSTFTNVTITLNASDHLGGGINNNGSQLLTLNNCAITDNVAGSDGGGVWGNYPTTLNNCRLSGNQAKEDGGGICSGITAIFLINNSTLNANSAVRNGGGVSTDMSSTTTLNNCTLSANGAQGYAGAIYNKSGTTSTFFCTMAGNIGDTDANGGSTGGIWNESGSVQIWNSLLAENYTNQVANDISGNANVTSQDYNYVQSGNLGLSGTTTHNIYGGDPLLDGLHDNGGATQTRALFAGSPALDRIPANLCRDSFGTAPIPDQRNVARPVGSSGDMGAFEGSIQPIYGRNLVRNGNAEDGAGSPTGVVVGAPHWSVFQGQFTVVPYNAAGGFPNTSTDPVPADHGYNFFSGGNVSFSQARQSIDLSVLAGGIDGGTQAYTFSGDFGGFATDTDAAVLALVFLDSNQAQIGSSVTLGPYPPSDRGNVTGFKNHSTTGFLPAGTRSVRVVITMNRGNGTADDAYLDNVSFVLAPPATLGNVSTRAFVQTQDNVMIGGFIVSGSVPKKVLVRGIGPSLSNFGVANALADPILELHSGSATLATNDNWGDAPNALDIANSNLAPSNSQESAILTTLNPGGYTAIVRGAASGTGVALFEAYDLDSTVTAKLGNISTRAFVQPGDNAMIGGFITRSGSENVLVRAIGPSLTNFGVPNALADPILELHDVNGTLIASNDDWKTGQQSQIQTTGLAPSNDAESAILQTLAPGNYTAIVTGKGSGSGVAIVEAYALN